MMHKVRSGIEEVPFYILRYPSNFKVTRAIRSTIFTCIGRFQTATPVLDSDVYELRYKV